ncbi:hypothetical protein ACQP1W_52495 (plasmid) [Spirillospora sp. CA-255316]
MRRMKTVPTAPTVSAEPTELAAELERERELADARRADELARTRAEARHERSRADVAEETRQAEMARAEREAQAAADAELAAMYRRYRSAGERTRIKSEMARSGEARALGLAKLRALNLKVLVPVLIGCAAWSTTGVQAGAARLMGVDTHSSVWWALWILEPVLISAVVWIIIVRARLAACGGRLAQGAERIAVTSLVTSIFLNLIAAVPDDASKVGFSVIGSMFAHALGPVGAAVTAHLIGVVDHSIAEADPWHDEHGQAVPRLAEMDLKPPVPTFESTPEDDTESASDSASEDASPRPVTMWPPVGRGHRPALPIIARPAENSATTASENGHRSTAEQPRQQEPEAPAKAPRKAPTRAQRPRSHKGVPVPESAKPAPPPPLTDEEQCERLASLIDRGELSEDVSLRQLQSALGVGFARAKAIRALYDQRAHESQQHQQQVESAPSGLETVGERPLLMVAGGNR